MNPEQKNIKKRTEALLPVAESMPGTRGYRNLDTSTPIEPLSHYQEAPEIPFTKKVHTRVRRIIELVHQKGSLKKELASLRSAILRLQQLCMSDSLSPLIDRYEQRVLKLRASMNAEKTGQYEPTDAHYTRIQNESVEREEKARERARETLREMIEILRLANTRTSQGPHEAPTNVFQRSIDMAEARAEWDTFCSAVTTFGHRHERSPLSLSDVHEALHSLIEASVALEMKMLAIKKQLNRAKTLSQRELRLEFKGQFAWLKQYLLSRIPSIQDEVRTETIEINNQNSLRASLREVMLLSRTIIGLSPLLEKLARHVEQVRATLEGWHSRTFKVNTYNALCAVVSDTALDAHASLFPRALLTRVRNYILKLEASRKRPLQDSVKFDRLKKYIQDEVRKERRRLITASEEIRSINTVDVFGIRATQMMRGATAHRGSTSR